MGWLRHLARKRVSPGQKGQALIEFVLVVLVYALLFLGILDIGRVMVRAHQLTQVAREGARVASQTPRITNAVAQQSITNKMNQILTDMGIQPAGVSITITPVITGGEVTLVDITVTQSVTTAIGVSLIPGLSSLALTSTISMPYFY